MQSMAAILRQTGDFKKPITTTAYTVLSDASSIDAIQIANGMELQQSCINTLRATALCAQSPWECVAMFIGATKQRNDAGNVGKTQLFLYQR
mmetsp:Transcript_18728/g.26107  ORF Transcript_18728/g.26107 Transcript_18728/m.26107 type:complete len:92 (+) Transcript_18728:106-381(+)